MRISRSNYKKPLFFLLCSRISGNSSCFHRWTASDGVELAWHEVGQGRTAILLHGLFSDAQMNWIKFGHAERIASAGFRVIMPDLRAHGLSGKPHEERHYNGGILAQDVAEYRRSLVASNPAIAPAGGVRSSATDLAVLLRAMLDRTVVGADALEPVQAGAEPVTSEDGSAAQLV